MFKVMIVDEEIFVISLIEKLIDWKRLNMEVVGKADNGVTALEEVERLKPDIVIVDVRMPGYDGITFMQKVREINDKVKFIVISGHKRFEYAKSAMQYNVEDYLLKPISKEELEQILDKLKNKLETEKKSEEVLMQLDDKLGVSTKKLQTYLCKQLMQEKEGLKEESLWNLNKVYYTYFKPGLFNWMVLKLDVDDAELDQSFTNSLLSRMESKLRVNLESAIYETVSCTGENTISFLFNYEEGKEQSIQEILKESMNELNQILMKFDKLYLTIGVGLPVKDLSDINRSFLTVEESIKSRMALGLGKVISHYMVKRDSGIIHVIFPDTECKKLQEAYKSFHVDTVRLQVLEAFSKADGYKFQSTLIYEEILWYMHQSFYEYMQKIDIYKGTYEQFTKELEKELIWAASPRQMAGMLLAQIKSYIEEYTEEDRDGENPAVRIAKKYIAENYQKNISMSAVAELVQLSSVYFSVLFKKEVGINFLDYLNQYRIEEAKKLLRLVKYNVNEVAGLAGFQDARYFSKIFKKNVGVTPTEYRNRNIK